MSSTQASADAPASTALASSLVHVTVLLGTFWMASLHRRTADAQAPPATRPPAAMQPRGVAKPDATAPPSAPAFRHADLEFAIDVTVHAGDSETPLSSHRMVFTEGRVYDFDRLSPRFTTVIDAAAKRIVKLDRQSSVKSTIATDELIEQTAKAKVSETDPLARRRLGLDTPAVEVDPGVYAIEFAGVRYQTTSREVSSDRARAFGQFADWAMRLNIASGSPVPPFARMTLNQTLAEARRIPATLTVTASSRRFVCRHAPADVITDSDREAVLTIRDAMPLYREVAIEKFPEP